MDDSEPRGTPNEMFAALMREVVSPVDLHEIMDCDLYKATQAGNVERFVEELRRVSKSRKLDLSLIFDQVTPSGNSLLHVAASSGKERVIELIHSHFPHFVTRKNYLEDTPLHVAVRNGRKKATRMLISQTRGLGIMYWKNKDGKSPLYLAAENLQSLERGSESPELVTPPKKRAILKLLLEESARDGAYADKIQGMSPVFAACKVKNPDLLKKIIHMLPKLLHMRDENGGTPLHVAASVGSSFVVELLLEKCPYLALQTDKNGSYPIHIACELGRFYTVQLLLKKTWPDLAEMKNRKGQNILHVAAKAGSERLVYYMCVDIVMNSEIYKTQKLMNLKDDNGNTPLHLASMHNHFEVMHCLTTHEKIDLCLRNNDALTALDVAVESTSLSTRNSALVGRAILIVAGVPRSEGRDDMLLREQGSEVSKASLAERIKDQVNILLLVATLVASVTFAAGLTLPGGYNASGDLHPGTATMLHHGMFQVFIIANMVAMYSSILAVVVLLWGLNRDYYVAELAYHSAGPLLLMALTGMSVAFFAAVTVAVSRLTWLGSLVLSVGVLYLVMVVVVLAALIFPSSKTTMRIVVFYYIVVSLVHKFVKFWVRVYDFIMDYVVVVYDFIMGYVVEVYDFIMGYVVTVCRRIRDSYGRCSRELQSPSSTPLSSSLSTPVSSSHELP